MRRSLTLLAVLIAGTARAADEPKPNTLTPGEIADGWVLVFDGETTFGWSTEGTVSVDNGELRLGGPKESIAKTAELFGDFQLRFEYVCDGSGPIRTVFNGSPLARKDTRAAGDWLPIEFVVKATDKGTDITLVTDIAPKPLRTLAKRLRGHPILSLGIATEAGERTRVRNIKLKPLGLDPIFNGKDLSGWKRFTANEKQAKSKFTVTSEAWLNVTNGPGDLQTEKQWADFVFQGECISNGKNLNSGVFFRCLPGQYQQGYEMQIHNGFKDGDRTKPIDYGTGAIYRRVPARKVVSSDGEWFALTLIARGKQFRTWVNGYPTVDWTDDRKEADNARNGSKLAAGPISIQGHDPTTNLSFRNLRVAELK